MSPRTFFLDQWLTYISQLEESISKLFEEGDVMFYALQQRAIGAGRAAPDPLS